MCKLTEAAVLAALDTDTITAWMESKPPSARIGKCHEPGLCVIAEYLKEQFPRARRVLVDHWNCRVDGVRVSMESPFANFIEDWDTENERTATRSMRTTLRLWRKHMYEEARDAS